MSLPATWVDRIFEKLTLTYGRDFTDRYAGIDSFAVKAEWARELSGQTGPSIAFALDYLPPAKPPTAIEFRIIANRAPEYKLPALPAPKTNTEVVRHLLAKAKDAVSLKQSSKAYWAHALMARAEAGEIQLTQTQREMVATALQRNRRPEEEE